MEGQKTIFQLLLIFLGIALTTTGFGHEPWLLTAEQIQLLHTQPNPTLFTQLTLFNSLIGLSALLGVMIWIIIHWYFPPQHQSQTHAQPWISFVLRLGAGVMLILLSLGLLPRSGVPYFAESTMLAPEFLLSHIPQSWAFLQWMELTLGIGLVLGLWTRFFAFIFLLFMVLCCSLYGHGVLQYCGFYLGITYYLLTQGGGKFALTQSAPSPLAVSPRRAFLILQILTGINFIYSAITIKLFQPNLDIAILTLNQAFTFGIPYEYFVFMMLITEIIFGLLIILGWRLRLISILLLVLFVFLSIDVSENLLAHSFIYGILAAFFITAGVPLIQKK
ncbi:MAG: DoxX family membrane protein [Gammaproteobacteria bacterium]|nr:DoxX family membrane protein [Gammaproteobacteria bacterium]